MAKARQPQHLNKYANLNRPAPKKHRPVKKTKKTGRFAWFRNLSRRRKLLVLATPVALFLILVPLITYLSLASDIKDPERLMNRNNTGIVLTDVNGTAFYSVGRAEHRNLVPLDQISDNMKNALVASEDKDFYKHGGFSVPSIVRALFTGVGGGSTLTQQLVKNTLLSDDRSYLRKYQELFMAIAVEQNYSKDQILDMYLNSAFFGENAFGVDEASQFYFGISPKDLDLAQSAMLVGLLPAPNAYSPISGNADYARERQTTVLGRMVKNNYITADQQKQALDEKLVYASNSDSVNSVAPHFAEMVINQLSQQYGYETVMRSGFQVKTTLNLNVQKTLNDSVAAQMPYIDRMGGSNASAIIIDPTTGAVRGLVGSADYNNPNWGKVNMVTTARQPGSSFKPIYYSAALADGVVTPSTILHDVKTDFGGGYVPLDADKRFRGDVTVRSAISQSLNIPSVELMQKFTIDKSIQAAKNLGITTVDPSKQYGLSLALGAAEVPLEQMAHAYASFANGGNQYDLRLIDQISNKFDKKVQIATPKSHRAISSAGAYLISNILSDNSARAPIFGGSLTIPGHTVAVKTGTTNDNRDAWTIGYNPQYVVGVWVGNNDNTMMSSGGSDMAGPIWRNTMIKLLSGSKDTSFAMPDTIVQRQVCRGNGGLADRAGPNTYNEVFMVGALPTNTCQAEPVMIEVCNLSTGQVESIDETKFDETKYSKDTTNCGNTEITVCDLSSGKVRSIKASQYDDTKYSRDTTNCNQSSNTVEACDTTTGKVVDIKPSNLEPPRYTTNIDNCQKQSTSGGN